MRLTFYGKPRNPEFRINPENFHPWECCKKINEGQDWPLLFSNKKFRSFSNWRFRHKTRSLSSLISWASMFNDFTFFLPFMTMLSAFSLLVYFFYCLCCMQYEPRLDCSLRRSLIRDHTVCFHDTSGLDSRVHLNTCSWGNRQITFSAQKCFDRIRVSTYVIIRDYLKVFWLSPEVSALDPIISLRALALPLRLIMGSRVDTEGDNHSPVR